MVEIELDDEIFELVPTLKACMTLSKRDGGITVLINKCQLLDFEAIRDVIVAGLGKNARELPDKIYRAGLLNLSPSCIRFLHIIANGGKSIDDESEMRDPTGPKSNSKSITES